MHRLFRYIVRQWRIKFNPLALDEDDYVDLALSGCLPERRRLGRRLARKLAYVWKPPLTIHAVRFFGSDGTEIGTFKGSRELAKSLLIDWGLARGLKLAQFFVEAREFGTHCGYGATFIGQIKEPSRDTRLVGRGFYNNASVLGNEEPLVLTHSDLMDIKARNMKRR